MNYFPYKSYLNESLAQKEREENYNDENENTLRFGKYDNGWDKLWIKSNHSYIFYLNISFDKYKYFPSEGTQERKGNVLTLYDTSVKCPFYLIITENGLKPNQMMFSLHDRPDIFYYIEEKNIWWTCITIIVIITALLLLLKKVSN